MNPRTESRASLAEVAGLFLKLGVIGVGGPAAHIALMREEVVHRRRWLTDDEFMDLVGATNLIPGPNSTELAIHIGRLQAGWRGLVVAGCSFILPAVVIVGALAAVYVRLGSVPGTTAVFYGVNPVVIAIVLTALWHLSRAIVRSVWHAALAVAALAGVTAGLHEIVVLAAAGLAGAIGRASSLLSQGGGVRSWVPPTLWIGAMLGNRTASGWGAWVAPAATASSALAVSFGTLFLVFLKAGALLFGSGYVLLAFLRADLVDR